MTHDYSNLRSKTIFDFTDEKTAEKYAICTKEEQIEYLQTNPWRVAYTLIRFASDTDNKELLHEVESQYADVISKIFNE